MKAPRKTVKRPIYRHINNDDKVEIPMTSKDNEKDVKLVNSESNNKIEDVLNTPMIEFDNKPNTSTSIEPTNDIFDDIDFNINLSFTEIIDIDDGGLEFLLPIDFDGII